jgi:hypothetical protein
MSGRQTNDYKEDERLFVVEGKSYRDIEAITGHSFAAIGNKARKDDWKGKRQAYMNAIARRSYENIASSIVAESTEIKNEAILAGRATIRSYLNALQKGEVKVNPKDAQLWAAFLMAELTPGHADTSSEVPDVRNVTPPDSDLLRRVVEAARERVAPAGSVGPAPLVEPSSSRPN